MPPKPLMIGITGHRPNRLTAPDAVAADMAKLLDGIGGAARRQDLSVEFVSALAEGADRIAANAALARHWVLHVVLPFALEEYEKDFPGSLAEFSRLIERAADVTMLPGAADRRSEAYEAASLWMLDRAAIVIAVWDGGPSAGRGGTSETVAAALARKKPVVWVDAGGRKPPAIAGEDGDDVAGRIARAAISWPGP